ncbi:hypothetical protein LP419_13035 [Massilia sp. H-1]|nr:hypothetical protein LP419_13035 [Massilia sp. H-1]
MYLKLAPGVSPAAVTAQLQGAVDRSPLRAGFPADYLTQLGERKLMEVRLWLLRDAYFQSDIQVDDKPALHGDRRSVFALVGRGAPDPGAGRDQLRQPVDRAHAAPPA